MYKVSTKGITLENLDETGEARVISVKIGDVIKVTFESGEITGGVVSFTDEGFLLNTSATSYGTNLVNVQFELLDNIEFVNAEEEPKEDETDKEPTEETPTDDKTSGTEDTTVDTKE